MTVAAVELWAWIRVPSAATYALVVIALSVVLLGLIGHGLAFKPDPASTLTLSAAGQAPYTIAYLPYYLQQGSYIITIAAGCGGVPDGLLAVFLALRRTPSTAKVHLPPSKPFPASRHSSSYS